MKKLSIKKNAQAGFTLIELIVVIVILGILAATALPKFTSLGGEARLASLQAARGAMASASAMIHGKYLVTPTVAAADYVIEGATIKWTTLPAGYPKADSGFAAAAGLADDYTIVVAGAATDTSPLVPANSIGIVPTRIAGTATAVKCFVTYTEPTAANTAPVITLGASATADNCK